ncbi:MAG: hypothetical protein Q9218_000100 [Villophora microphyllina]
MGPQNKHVYSTVTPFENTPPTPRKLWNPSILRRLPWKGFGAMLGAIAAVSGAIVVLMLSDRRPTASWSLQPAVYLAIASTLANVFIHFALGQAICVAWWRRATQPTTKISDLHRHWNYGDSLWASLTSGRQMNVIALASVLVAIVPINGPFLQRASRVGLGKFVHDSPVQIQIAQQLPLGYTGIVASGRGRPYASFLTPEFKDVVNATNNLTPITIVSKGCAGECTTRVQGAGFTVDCAHSTVPFDIQPPEPASDGTFPASAFADILAFETLFDNTVADSATLKLDLQFKGTSDCAGSLEVRNCTFKAATVNYPVVINGNKTVIELAPGTTMSDDHVMHTIDGVDERMNPYRTTLGGFSKAFMDTYKSSASMGFKGAVRYRTITEGATASRYATLSSDSGQNGSAIDCSIFYGDPTEDLIQAVRSMMFRTAVAASNASDAQTVSAQDMVTVPVYQSHYLYLGVAIVFTALAWLATLPVFIGWWHVGRNVSMSPIETAKAFSAPMLQHSDPNANVDELMKEVGERPIRYGAVAYNNAARLDALQMYYPGHVRVPGRGQTFIG